MATALPASNNEHTIRDNPSHTKGDTERPWIHMSGCLRHSMGHYKKAAQHLACFAFVTCAEGLTVGRIVMGPFIGCFVLSCRLEKVGCVWLVFTCCCTNSSSKK